MEYLYDNSLNHSFKYSVENSLKGFIVSELPKRYQNF